MARLSVVFIFVLFTFASFVTVIHGRKLNINEDAKKQQQPPPSSQDSLYLSALPKGTVPKSAPSKKGHASIDNEKLIARHLAAIDRILRSVPSPGVGH